MHNVQSIMNVGAGGIVIHVECHQTNGLPAIIIVGLGNKAIEESKERIRAAYANTGLPFPRKRIAINLAPADVPKESTSLDLAIAAAIMQCNKQTKQILSTKEALIGELGLDGTVRPVRGLIGKILHGYKNGIRTFFISKDNLSQALLVPDITLYPLQNLKELYLGLNGEIELPRYETTSSSNNFSTEALPVENGMHAIVGQEQAKRALEIAAAGGHNIMMSGPPGTGKSMLAKALRSILPPLTRHEMLEVTHLHSLVGNDYEELITERPFRSPHHSASHISIVGGGAQARPGEVTLSHHGVLFLDEMPEFSRPTIEALRQPLEDHTITIARAKHSVQYPAHFILVATANPCPCGYYGSRKECRCTFSQISRYRQRVSGPILDRIDLHVEVQSVDHAKILKRPSTGTDSSIRDHVTQARLIQEDRYKSLGMVNATMGNKEIIKYACMAPAAAKLLDTAVKTLDISTRSYLKLIKTARTIADLNASPHIDTVHISEALQYRSVESSL